jgi:ABC-type dipeptide/oligopeptide/nickel transport system permease subunit
VTYVDVSTPPLEEPEVRGAPSFGFLRRLLRRPVAVLAIVVIAVVYLAGILAPVIAPQSFRAAPIFDPANRDIAEQLTFQGPSLEHPLGTDDLGRDMLSRVIWSAQTTVIVSGAAVLTGGLALGVTLGLLAGYARGRLDDIIMRLADGFYAVPTLLLLLIINATLMVRVTDFFRDLEDWTGIEWLVSSGAPSYFVVFGALALFGWVGMARLVRSQVLSLRESDYVMAAQAAGASTLRVLFRHLLPNVSNLILVAVTLSLGATASLEVALTWLGIGIQPPHPSFGVLIFDGSGVTNLRAHPQLLLIPAVVVAALVLSFNLLGDALNDVMNPHRR